MPRQAPVNLLPDMGDPNRMFYLVLNEPEVNTLFYALAFVKSALDTVKGFPVDQLNSVGYLMLQQAKHYGPTLASLDAKVAFLDDTAATASGPKEES